MSTIRNRVCIMAGRIAGPAPAGKRCIGRMCGSLHQPVTQSRDVAHRSNVADLRNRRPRLGECGHRCRKSLPLEALYPPGHWPRTKCLAACPTNAGNDWSAAGPMPGMNTRPTRCGPANKVLHQFGEANADMKRRQKLLKPVEEEDRRVCACPELGGAGSTTPIPDLTLGEKRKPADA